VGCKNSATLQLSTHPSPTILVASTATAVCPFSTVSFTASGASTYTWNTGPNGPVLTVTAATNNTFMVQCSNGLGCISNKIVSVSTKSVPLINIAATSTLVCAGEVVSLSAKGASSYTWMPGNTTGPNYTVAPAMSSVYAVNGLSANGCTNTAVVVIATDPCNNIVERALSPIRFYPNPSQGQITIETPAASQVKIYSCNGLQLFECFTEGAGSKTAVKDLPVGIYFLWVKCENHLFSEKIVVE
jgi:hypothetical protein